jgi:hypothetical protein
MTRMIRAIAGPQRMLLSALVTIAAAALFAGPAMAGSPGCEAREAGHLQGWRQVVAAGIDILLVKQRAG